jgi:hypothetical protein
LFVWIEREQKTAALMTEGTLHGGCLCGAVRYEIATGPQAGVDPAALLGTYCHCSMCRKATGGGYATLLSIPREAVRWTKGSPTLYRSSPIATRGFCRQCGSPLFYDGEAEKQLSLTAGSLDDPSGIKPDHHYGIESRLPWADCGPDLPGRETEERFEGQP